MWRSDKSGIKEGSGNNNRFNAFNKTDGKGKENKKEGREKKDGRENKKEGR